MTFTAKIDPSLAPKLQNDLAEQGFAITHPPYTFFSAKKKGLSCTFYQSGSLIVQGKEMKEFMEFYLEPEILKTFQYSHPEAHLNLTARIGMDEAGKGDFFGPLCVAALFADEEGIKKLHDMKIKDSKKMSDETIVKKAIQLKGAYSYTVIRLFPAKYNELYAKFKNLNRLLAWAHSAALCDLSAKTGCKKAVLDQFASPSLVLNMLAQKKVSIDLEQKVRAEEDLVVAAASILARASFLDGIELLSEEHGIALPKGAASQVKEAARRLIQKFGKDILSKTAKTHFKTMGEL